MLYYGKIWNIIKFKKRIYFNELGIIDERTKGES